MRGFFIVLTTLIVLGYLYQEDIKQFVWRVH